MKVAILAVGRAARGEERSLVERYLERARGLGRGIGLGGFSCEEFPESRRRSAADRRVEEGARLLARLGARDRLFVLDEGGRGLSSRAFAERLAACRDDGAPALALAIGGPDGHGDDVRARADLVWSLGAHTMAHLLVRAVLAEQLYRATTILAGHPYHRD